MNDEIRRWNDYADTYEKDVFSLTKYPFILKSVLSEIPTDGNILDLGCGALGRTLNALLAHGCLPVGIDHSVKMLNSTANVFDGALICGDSRRLPFKDNSFGGVVSLNSILPSEQSDVSLMLSEIYRVLKPGGKLVAVVIWMTWSFKYVDLVPGEEKFIDRDNLRQWDSGGWQCGFTNASMVRHSQNARFTLCEMSSLLFNQNDVKDDLIRIYGYVPPIPLEQLFVVLTK